MGEDKTRKQVDGLGFEQRLSAARDRAGLGIHQSSPEKEIVAPNPFSFAMRLGAEMVAALVVSIALGYGLDRLFGTAPWLMIAFVPIGAVAGFRNIMRLMGPG